MLERRANHRRPPWPCTAAVRPTRSTRRNCSPPQRLQERRLLRAAARGVDGGRGPDRRRLQPDGRDERAHGGRVREAEPRGRQGGQGQPARLARRGEGLVGGLAPARQRARRRPGAADDRDGARDRRGGEGRPVADDGARARRAAARRRVPAHRPHREHDGGPARRLRVGGDARGARGRHRGQARRPGAGQGRRGHLEGPDRQRQPDGEQPDRPGAQHRRGHDGRREGRPLEEDHGRRARARSSSSRTRSTRWWTSCARSPRR